MNLLILWIVTSLPTDWRYFCKRLGYVANRQKYGCKVKKAKAILTPKQEANKLARESGGKLLSATGYVFVQEGRLTQNFRSVKEFIAYKRRRG